MQRLVIDTNILVNALRKGGAKNSRSRRLLKDVFLGKYDIYISSKIENEYLRILNLKHLSINPFLRAVLFIWLHNNAIYIEPNSSDQAHVEMKDEDDRIFFDVAKCVNAKLVTRNVKDYPVHEIITLIEELYP